MVFASSQEQPEVTITIADKEMFLLVNRMMPITIHRDLKTTMPCKGLYSLCSQLCLNPSGYSAMKQTEQVDS
jgi:hypothetical protein